MLSPAQRATLSALDASALVEARLARTPPHLRQDLTRVLAVPGEGPASGASTPAEPVARTGFPERVAPLVRSVILPVAPPPVAPPHARDPGHAPSPAASFGRVVPGQAMRGDGREVIVLESGGLWTAADFTEQDAEMGERPYADQGLRATDDLGVALLQGDTVGGSTTVSSAGQRPRTM